jgi:signal transduction histidine kinase/DNA-binding LacI/PurR family transcriptional regulator
MDKTGPVPFGFGRGRKTNRIAVIHTNPVAAVKIPGYLGRWAATERLDTWTRSAADGLLCTAGNLGFSVIWQNRVVDEPLDHFLDQLTPEYADAAVLFVSQACDPDLLTGIKERGIIYSLAYGRGQDEDAPSVTCDNTGGMAQVVRHLANLGHRRIAYLEPGSHHEDHRDRKAGYLKAMEELGLAVDEALLGTAPDDMSSATTAGASRLLRQSDRPTAVVCANDLLAMGVIDACWSLGLRVPQDVAVVGFDDVGDGAHVAPPLTTVRQPVGEISGYACFLSACIVAGHYPDAGWHMELPSTLVVRDSCGARLAGQDGTESSPSSTSLEMPYHHHELEMRIRQLAAINQEMQDFLNVASHDLRAPLITIDGFAGSLERNSSHLLDEKGKKKLASIRRSAAHLQDLTNALLKLSREQNQPLYKNPQEVGEILADVVHDMSGLIAEKKAVVSVSKILPTVLADDMALRQIFSNLIGNALKYLGDQPRPSIVIRYTAHEQEHEFSVTDNGIGIAPEHQDEIFKLFRRLPGSETEGSGIGLTTAKRWVLRHGGRIWVESQVGQGATFKFTLPRTPVDAEVPAPVAAEA